MADNAVRRLLKTGDIKHVARDNTYLKSGEKYVEYQYN